jgi:ketosteroid isomerase-like protein
MARSSLETFSALWRAYGEGRLDRALDLLAADCEVTFIDGTTAVRGRDGVRQWLATQRTQWKSVTVSYNEVHEERPGFVLGVGRLTASSVDGEEVDRRVAFVAEFADGRLVRGRVFGDREDAARYVRAAR